MKKPPSPKNKPEEQFARDIRAMRLPEPRREYRWAAEIVGTVEEEGRGFRRRLEQSGLKDWRFDFAWPEFRLAFEIEGLHSVEKSRGYGAGRHLTPTGYVADAEKYTEARLHGWAVYQIPSPWVKQGKAIDILIRALKFHGRLARVPARIRDPRRQEARYGKR